MTNKRTTAIVWLLITFMVIVFSALAHQFGYESIADRSILSTLARIQAAIFAIVFSVVILGVRLSATRYSPRLASTFSSDPVYRWTVGIFAFSIGFDIAVLYFFNIVKGQYLTVLVIVAGGLTAGAFWALYDFVNKTLEKTTPEGILTQIEENLTPESIVESAHDSAEDPANRDPFLVLISVIQSTIDEGDRVSASIGLNILGSKVSGLLDFASDNEFDEDAPVDMSLENVCVDQLPDIAEEAVEEELTQTAIEVTDTAETIGQTATEQEIDRVLEHVLRGQSHLVNNLGYEQDTERIRYEAMDTSSDLLKNSADQGVWTGCAIGTRLLGWLAAASIMNRSQSGNNRGYTSLLILCFPKLVTRAIGSDEELNDHPVSRWLRAHRLEEVNPAELLIVSSYASMTELTSAAIRYELRTGHQIVEWDQVAAGWSNGLDNLSDSNLISMTELWFGTVLYLEYLQDVTPSGVMGSFSVHIHDRELAQETIDKILEGELNPRKLVDYLPGGRDPVEFPLTGIVSSPVSNPDEEFKEWLNNRRHMFGNLGMGMEFNDEDSDSEAKEE
jgi:hypothetical protein